MTEPTPEGRPESGVPAPPDPADLGWVRWGVTFVGVALAAVGYGHAADPQAAIGDRVRVGLIGLGGLGFALSMWVPAVARVFGWVLNKLR